MADLNNLQAEKLQKEISKLDAEIREINGRISSKSIWTPRIIQIIIGTIIAVAAIAAFVISTVVPAMQMNSNLASLENRVQAARNDSIHRENQRTNQILSQAIAEFKLQLASLDSANKSYEQSLTEMQALLDKEKEKRKSESKQYQKLAKDRTKSEQERKRYKSLYDNTQQELQQIAKKDEQLKKDKIKSKSRSKTIFKELSLSAKMQAISDSLSRKNMGTIKQFLDKKKLSERQRILEERKRRQTEGGASRP